MHFTISRFSRIVLTLVLIVSLLGAGFYAVAQTYNFQNYSVKDGLVQSNVNGVVQDKEGYLWFATNGGLSKFDGKNFVNYSTRDGLPELAVQSLCIDNSDRIWMAHTLGRLSIFDNGKVSVFELNLLEKNVRFQHLFCDSRGNIWLSTIGSGAVKISPGKTTPEILSINQNLSDVVFRTYEDKERNIWFVSDVGLKKMNPETGEISFFKPSGLPFFEYIDMLEDRNGNLWLATRRNGVVRYNIADGSISRFSLEMGMPGSFVTCLQEAADGSIFCGTWKEAQGLGGLAIIKNDEVISIQSRNGLASDKITCLFMDKEKSIWVGLNNNGISRFKGLRFVHYTLDDGLAHPIISALCTDKNNRIWAGTEEGISVLELQRNGRKKITNIDASLNIRDNQITCLKPYGDKMLAASFRGDIGVFSTTTLKFENYISINKTFINCIETDDYNNLWIGTVNGVTQYNFATREFKDIMQLEGLNVYTILSDGEKVWFGTREGGLHVKKGNNFIKIEPETGLTHKSPTALCLGESNKIWVGTEGGGLFYGNESGFEHIRFDDKAFSDYIKLVHFEKNGMLWAGTNLGLFSINPTNNSTRLYQEPEGFRFLETQSNAVTKDLEGNLWYGTNYGLIRYTGKEDNINTLKPKIIISGYKIFNAYSPFADNQKFNHEQKDFTFFFSSLSFRNPDRIQYRYMLEGFDADWQNEISEDNIHYSNIPPGNYTFKVLANNGEGAWSETPATFMFTIKPPFYQTTWFIAMCLLIITASVWSYIYFRTLYLRKAKIMLENQVKERTQEIEQKNVVLEENNVLISNKNKEITDSINYAKRIQEAILPSSNSLREIFPQSFILYRPKDIVSGDFYWFKSILQNGVQQNDTGEKVMVKMTEHYKQSSGQKFLFSVADCTGHGVPGAFMCMIGNSLLNQIVEENGDISPAEILNLLHIGIRNSLKQQETETRDGMDIAICSIDRQTHEMQYAGALRPLFIFRKNKSDVNPESADDRIEMLEEVKPDKFPIGGHQAEEHRNFNNNNIKLHPGDTLYLTTDGFADQFGGEKGKKLMTRKLKEIMAEMQSKSMLEQFRHLNAYFDTWKGELEQVDDVLIMAIRI
jgi:ligand-binding sensor domain-containing protein/serine phosphatase RsbU (regulator of sigma subunit)